MSQYCENISSLRVEVNESKMLMGNVFNQCIG